MQFVQCCMIIQQAHNTCNDVSGLIHKVFGFHS